MYLQDDVLKQTFEALDYEKKGKLDIKDVERLISSINLDVDKENLSTSFWVKT